MDRWLSNFFAHWGLEAGIAPEKKIFLRFLNLHYSITACTAITSYYVSSRLRKLHQALIMRPFTDSPSRAFNCTFTTISIGLSNHGHYRHDHGFLFDLRPILQVLRLEDAELAQARLRVPRAGDLSLAVLQCPYHRTEMTKELDLK